MGDSPLLKGALFVLSMMLAIFLFMPKCPQGGVGPLRVHKTEDAAAPKGLRIESSTPPPLARGPVGTYPEGLDAQRVQYLVETNTHFAEPKTAKFSKDSKDPNPDPVVTALRHLGYIEAKPDGAWGLTRDGAMNASATDLGDKWSVPIAKREFVRVTLLKCDGDQCNADFGWKWKPNNVGQAMQLGSDELTGRASLNGVDRHWLLNAISGID